MDAGGSAAKAELQHQEKLMGHLRNVIKHIKGERQRRKEAGEDYSVHVLKEVLHEDLVHLEFPEEGIRMPVKSSRGRCWRVHAFLRSRVSQPVREMHRAPRSHADRTVGRC